jgi:hydroxymethylpyrimidine/phosphomethylpyrimidine kinase
MIARVLSIAGSDPSGGAGIQADLKAFSAMGAYGMAALTALTAQNTRGVFGVHEVPPAFVAAQLEAIFADVQVDAVKIGMLSHPAVIEVVAAALERHQPRHVVLDPVMVAKSGDRLLREEAIDALRSRLLPLATLVTPNLPELGALLGAAPPQTEAEMRAGGAALLALGARAALIKGGHLPGAACVDLLVWPGGVARFAGPRIETAHTHGTGCSLSSAVAARLGRGEGLEAAVGASVAWLRGAIAAAGALGVGGGHGPVHHFHALW